MQHMKPIEILLVEDNPGDVLLTQEAFSESKVLNNMHAVSDGVEALDFLYKRGAYEEAVRPDIILMDLNLPRMDGRQVIKQIKADETLKHIPVIVLTTSSAEEDVLKSYDLHANAYVTKPNDLDKFMDVVRTINDFWFSIVRLPLR
jgi:CheY-like chemotaxis protein